MNILPYNRQTIDEDDIQAVVNVLRSDYLTRGPKVPEFEKALCDYTGAKHAVVFSSATTALYALLDTVKGDKVTTSPYTFAATANCVEAAGKLLSFTDVGSDGNLVPDLIYKNADILIAVDFAGKPCEYQKLRQNFSGVVIADAAHSFGADGVGTLADFTVLSFHAIKTITTGEGGAVLTDNTTAAEQLRTHRNHGIDSNKDLGILGNNYHMTDFQAALGISQLKKIDQFVARRRYLAELYQKELPELIDVPKNSSFHLLPIFISRRDEVKKILLEKGIQTQIHYKPVYHNSWYDGFPYLPKTEELYSKELSLPLFPSMNEGDVLRVCAALKEAMLVTGAVRA